MNVSAKYFEQLYDHSTDPWHFRTRWYEQRKRDITMAALPHRQYERGFEPGCSNGELSLRLADRCRELLCCDLSAQAVELAATRLYDQSHVTVEKRELPEQWPSGRFDLIVLSEICYYLDNSSLHEFTMRARDCLTSTGVLMACHWRHPIEGCPLSGDEVHTLIDQHLALPLTVMHQEPDVILSVWSADPVSVAEREGLLGGGA